MCVRGVVDVVLCCVVVCCFVVCDVLWCLCFICCCFRFVFDVRWFDVICCVCCGWCVFMLCCVVLCCGVDVMLRLL